MYGVLTNSFKKNTPNVAKQGLHTLLLREKHQHNCLGSKPLRLGINDPEKPTTRDDSKVATAEGYFHLFKDNKDGTFEGKAMKTSVFSTSDIGLEWADWSLVGVHTYNGDDNTRRATIKEKDVRAKLVLLPGNVLAEYPREWLTYILK